jgi:hypothetical protein
LRRALLIVAGKKIQRRCRALELTADANVHVVADAELGSGLRIGGAGEDDARFERRHVQNAFAH